VDERARRIESQLATAQAITHIGSWEWDMRTGVVTWSDELYRIYGFEPRSREVTFDFFLSRLHPEDRERVRGEVTQALGRGGRFAYLERIVRPDGSLRASCPAMAGGRRRSMFSATIETPSPRRPWQAAQ